MLQQSVPVSNGINDHHLPTPYRTLSSHWGDSFSNEEVLFRNLKQVSCVCADGLSSPVILLLMCATNMGHHCHH